MSKVVNLSGRPVAASTEPVPHVVAFLEGIVERARRGEVRAVAVTYVRPNGSPSEGWSGVNEGNNDVFALHSGIICQAAKLADLLNSTDTEATPIDPHEAPA